MYGFHKVADLTQLTESGNLRSWAFEHSGFVRDRPELLDTIQRKPKPKKKVEEVPKEVINEPPQDNAKLQLLLNEFAQTKKLQQQLQQQYKQMEKEKEILWREYAASQKQMHEQQQTTEKILTFLAILQKQYTSPTTTPSSSLKRIPSQVEEIEESDVFETLNLEEIEQEVPIQDSMEVESDFVDHTLQDLSQQQQQEPPMQFHHDFLDSHQGSSEFLDYYPFSCSMEEDSLIRNATSTPLSWVPS